MITFVEFLLKQLGSGALDLVGYSLGH
uniref:Uncharacterized protein n=1 Tax=Rhizophora mucronata TaxID=61149 RepID=A0A2P2MZI0_RHIMU